MYEMQGTTVENGSSSQRGGRCCCTAAAGKSPGKVLEDDSRTFVAPFWFNRLCLPLSSALFHLAKLISAHQY